MADAGLIGMPSVGKSSILSIISSANPKIGAYHFTTLSPNLGVVTTKKRQKFVMADLPGLIEGASLGVGLGYQFLRHATRCKVLCHVIDMAATEGRDPYEDYLKINRNKEEKLPEDTYYIVDLIGLDIYTEGGELLGKLDDIFSTGSNDVYVVKNSEGKQILLPAISDVIKNIDLEQKKIVVNLIEGLL